MHFKCRHTPSVLQFHFTFLAFYVAVEVGALLFSWLSPFLYGCHKVLTFYLT